MIEVDNITKRYGSITAVDHVSFDIDNGEIVGLLGPNGAGKTTVLRIITGFLHPDEGRVNVDDRDTMEDLVEAQRQIGYLPEFAPLYEDMDVVKYLDFLAGCRDIPKNKRDDRISEIAGKCDIRDQLHRPIEHLSKGYKQRIGLAQALLHDPEYLILDEPTTGLDPNQILDFREVIEEVGEEHTVLLSTHILQEVTALCNRIIVIHEGEIAADGSRESLLEEYGENALRVGIRADDGETEREQLQEKLKGVTGVQTVSSDSSKERESDVHRFYLQLENGQPEESGEAVYDLARDEGWRVTEISSETPSLETVFAKLTQPERV